MSNWIDTLTLDEDEYITTYKSVFFNKEIVIRFSETNSSVGENQKRLVDYIIKNEKDIMDMSMLSIIAYYNEYYPNYKEGWESGGADDAMIEKYLPKEINRQKLLKLIDPAELYINPEEKIETGVFGFALDCEWDVEHGLGISYENWKVKEVGGMDIAFL